MKVPPAKSPQPTQSQKTHRANGGPQTHEHPAVAGFDALDSGIKVHGHPNVTAPSQPIDLSMPVQLLSTAPAAPAASGPEEDENAWKSRIVGMSSQSASNSVPKSAPSGPLSGALRALGKNNFKERPADEPPTGQPVKKYNMREGLKHIGVETLKGAAADATKGAIVGAAGGTATLPGIGTVAGMGAGAGIGGALGGIGGAVTGVMDVGRSAMGGKATASKQEKANKAAADQTHTISQLASQTGQIHRQVSSNTAAIAALKSGKK